MRLSEKELYEVIGGSVSGNLINAIVRGIDTILDAGRSVGTAIRRIFGNSICPL